MSEGRDSLIRNPYVPIEAAAELVNKEMTTLRGWVAGGSLLVERRGDMEVVRLEQVRALASRVASSRNGVLRDRLKQAAGSSPATDLVIVTDLQDLVRNRVDRPGSLEDLVFVSAPAGRRTFASDGSDRLGGLASVRPEGRLPLILH